MHLAFLTPEYPHSVTGDSGGLGTSIKNLAMGLAGEGHRVTIFIPYQKKTVRFKDHTVEVHCIAQKRYRFANWFFYKRYIGSYINAIVKEENVDILEVPDWLGLTSFMQLEIPYIVRLHGSDGYFCHLAKRPQKVKNRYFEKQNLKNAAKIVSVSAYTAQKTKALFKISKAIEVIPNGIDTQRFKPSTSRKDPNKILYFGSIIRKKGVFELAQAFNIVAKAHPDAQLHYIGRDVPDYQTGHSSVKIIKELLSAEAGGRCVFLNALPYDEIKEHIESAMVVCLPSFAEALPMTWLETMALEKPLVASNIGWAPEMIEDGKTGYLVAPTQHQEMASQILHLLTHPKIGEKIGQNARQKVIQEFSNEVITQRNIDLYNSFLAH